jgi:hypothetical protein
MCSGWELLTSETGRHNGRLVDPASQEDPLRLESDIKQELFYQPQAELASTTLAAAVVGDYDADDSDTMQRRDVLCLQEAGQHVSLGRLHFSLLADYRGPGLEWRRFLAICSDATDGGVPVELYVFDVGKAGHLMYVRAYTEQEQAVGARWALQISRDDCSFDAASIILEGEINLVDCDRPRVLPSSLGVTQARTFRVTVWP